MKLIVCKLLILAKLTRSTWMACTQSCLSPWTRNRATLSFSWHPFLSLFCRTWFLYAALLPPWNEKEITDSYINIQAMHPLHPLHNIQKLGLQNKDMHVYVCHGTLNMISDLKIEKNNSGSLPSNTCACDYILHMIDDSVKESVVICKFFQCRAEAADHNWTPFNWISKARHQWCCGHAIFLQVMQRIRFLSCRTMKNCTCIYKQSQANNRSTSYSCGQGF